MKKTIFALFISLISFNAQSQDILESVTKEVCNCVEAKKDKLDTSNPQNLKMQLGLCILGSYSKHTAEIDKKYGKIMDDEAAMEKFGEDIGMKMVTVCPETLMSFAGAITDDETADSTAVEEVKQEDLFIEGEIVAFKATDFVTIQVKDKNARVHNMLMLDYFETASLYTNNQIKVKDKIKVSYTEIELYDPKQKEFRYFKVITALEKI